MKKRHTFTLVEILTTIAILAILAGISLGVTKLAFGKAHESKNQALIKMIEVALEQYKSKYGYYPNSGENPQLFFMDAFSLENDADDPLVVADDPLVVTNNMWQFFDENFRQTHVKASLNPTDSGSTKKIFRGYVVDAKGNPLIYICPGKFNTGSFDLGSVGEDEVIGDAGKKPKAVKDNSAVQLMKLQSTKNNDIEQDDCNNFGQGDDIVNFTNNEQ